ncbi:uncharacterized protein LOC126369245 [Pectinophora gossypiella]|uniref:uncharacterized protein LOC126369245 n=1 Tax=Pectinophora gossypiella TaxID=13191 RepID=UPI00214F1EC0|nr:uncharacterized protein LOC126369245 [Pectinophora gossypiella]XP_049869546.1 uncharacterized protein LOC126369245 [Pectinophora gossypiella]
MSARMWYTAQDVMNDLAEHTGIRIGDFEEEYIVRGEKPPPPRAPEEVLNDEFELRFGRDDAPPPSSGNLTPDLAGITHMLRLVDTFDAPGDQKKKIEKNEIPKETALEQSIIISKLNPNVHEFVPKSLQTVNHVNKTILKKDESNNNNENIDKETFATVHNEHVNDIEDTEKHMVAALKSKIIAASKDNSLEKKRDRNVAIAALVRLNSSAPESPKRVIEQSAQRTPKPTQQPETTDFTKTISPKPIVLFTPEYFVGASRSPTAVTMDTKPPLLTPTSSGSIDSLDPQVKQSIEKVSNWLSGPDKKVAKKPMVPLTEPISFKKKDSAATMSSCSDVSKKKESPYAAFVPSEYATQLAKAYRAKEEQKKEEQNMAPKTIWDKLENDLKAKDELIKKRRSEQATNSASNPSSSCSS